MKLFRSKAEKQVEEKKSLTALVRERILTAEGWRRKIAPKAKKGK